MSVGTELNAAGGSQMPEQAIAECDIPIHNSQLEKVERLSNWMRQELGLEHGDGWGSGNKRTGSLAERLSIDLDLSWADATLEREALLELFAKHS